MRLPDADFCDPILLIYCSGNQQNYVLIQGYIGIRNQKRIQKKAANLQINT